MNVFCEKKPVGGDADGDMGKKCDKVWKPVYLAVKAVLDPAAEAYIKAGKPYKADYDAATLQRKWTDFSKKYKDVRAKHGIRKSIDRGETGKSAADYISYDDRLASAQKDWKYFAQFHAAFGSCARYCSDLIDESITPKKPSAAPELPPAPGLTAMAPALDPTGSNDELDSASLETIAKDASVDNSSLDADDELVVAPKKSVVKKAGRFTARSVQMVKAASETRAEAAQQVSDRKMKALAEISEKEQKARLEAVLAVQAGKDAAYARKKDDERRDAKRQRIATARDQFMAQDPENMTPKRATIKARAMDDLLNSI